MFPRILLKTDFLRIVIDGMDYVENFIASFLDFGRVLI
jgi:hypothetical protein